jgi:hypothetical protein
VFGCGGDEQCVEEGRAGACESTGFCSFPDPSCPSGRRYGVHAGDGLARSCVPEMPDVADTSDGTAVADTGDADATSADVTGTPTSSSGPTSTSTSTTGEPGSSESGASDTQTTGLPLDPDLIAWYRFEDSLAGSVEDVTENQLHGSCVGCPTSTPGVQGDAALFDGDSQFIGLPSSPLFDLTDALTVCAWARIDDWSPGVKSIATRSVGEAQFNSWEVYVRAYSEGAPRLFFWLADTVEGAVGGSISIEPADDHWFHVAMTWDGAEARLYLDGEVVLSRALQVVVYDDHVTRIGADNDFGEDVNFFPGAIDEVQIYQRALSSDEVAELATR